MLTPHNLRNCKSAATISQIVLFIWLHFYKFKAVKLCPLPWAALVINLSTFIILVTSLGPQIYHLSIERIEATDTIPFAFPSHVLDSIDGVSVMVMNKSQ
jgi:hypothetical protein